MLRQIPASDHPGLLVGFETSDDAGVLVLSEELALVQTIDFFTPVVDDPYSYGQIAAANALSDIYAMGGRPLSVLNVACFDPDAAPSSVWAAVLTGMADKAREAGAAVLGGHSVEDREPKFGMAVTGLIHPGRVFANTNARPGDRIFLSKPLGTGIIATAAKSDQAGPDELAAAISTMSALNREAAETAHLHGVRCATDITGFGLAGHMFNVARGSGVAIEIESRALPVLGGVERLVKEGWTTGGAGKNRAFLGSALDVGPAVADWLIEVVLDPQTSGGLALFTSDSIDSMTEIGQVREGEPCVRIA